MHNISMKNQLAKSLFLLSIMSLGITSCVDDNYDFEEDIDMTMGLGSTGLSVKLGTTDKILLGDILEENDNTKTDKNSVYYIV